MALIYKPNALYMSPKNESIDVTDDITFSFMFKGYQLLSATGQIYQNSNIGEWQAIPNATFSFDNDNAPYYNNDVLSKTLSSGAAYTSINNNVNSTLGWGVTVYGVSSTQNASNNILIPAQKGFEMGDMVNVTGAGIPYTFIGSYDSKLSLGAVTSDTTAGDNVFAVSEAVYLNLTTGDKIQAITDTPPYYSNTAYYIRKINEGASDPTGYFIAIYSTKSEAESGTGTRVTSAVANKTFYVNPIPTSSSVFYVGLIGGNKIKLYTSKEAALQSVSEAVVQLTDNSSYTIQVFEKSQVVQFTPIMQNHIVFDENELYDNNGHGKVGLTLTVVGRGGSYTYAFSNNGNTYDLFDGQQITVVNGVTNTICYIKKLADANTIQLFSNRGAALGGDSTYLIAFDTSPLTAYISEVLTTNKDFVVEWQNNSNIPLVANWQARLYNVKTDYRGNIISEDLIEDSGIQYTGNVHYQFKHLLLSFDSITRTQATADFTVGTYKVVFTVTDTNGYVYIGELLIDVGYKSITASYVPNVFVNNCDSSITIDWKNASAIRGTTNIASGSIGNVSRFAGSEYAGTTIAAGKYITYNLTIPENSFPTFLFRPNSASFNGTIVTLDGSAQKITLSYSNSNHNFILTVINKNLGGMTSTYIVNTEVTTLATNKAYLIGYADGEIYIREYGAA